MQKKRDHWIVVSTLGCPDEQLLGFDSFHDTVDDECAKLLLSYFPNCTANMANVKSRLVELPVGFFR